MKKALYIKKVEKNDDKQVAFDATKYCGPSHQKAKKPKS